MKISPRPGLSEKLFLLVILLAISVTIRTSDASIILPPNPTCADSGGSCADLQLCAAVGGYSFGTSDCTITPCCVVQSSPPEGGTPASGGICNNGIPEPAGCGVTKGCANCPEDCGSCTFGSNSGAVACNQACGGGLIGGSCYDAMCQIPSWGGCNGVSFYRISAYSSDSGPNADSSCQNCWCLDSPPGDCPGGFVGGGCQSVCYCSYTCGDSIREGPEQCLAPTNTYYEYGSICAQCSGSCTLQSATICNGANEFCDETQGCIASCNSHSWQSTGYSPASPISQGSTFTISCDYNFVGDCIGGYSGAVSGNNRCTFTGFSGDVAQFSCLASNTGTQWVECRLESGTPNNCCARTDSGSSITVTAKPDLITQNLGVSGNRVTGQTVTLQGTTKNQGTVSAGSSVTQFKIDGVEVCAPSTGSLAVSSTEAESCSWAATTGSHTLEVRADKNNQVDEGSNEGNNAATYSFTVSDRRAPPCFPAGDTFGYGDVDADTWVTDIDAQWIQEKIVGLRTLTSSQIERADVNDAPNTASVAADVTGPDSTVILQYVSSGGTFTACPACSQTTGCDDCLSLDTSATCDCAGECTSANCNIGHCCPTGQQWCTGTSSCAITCSTTTTLIEAGCSGNVALALDPSTVVAASGVSPSASGLSNCNGKIVNFRRTSCTGTLVGSCTSGSTGCTATSAFTAPGTTGSYTYYACVDKNSDGTIGAVSTGESGSAVLTVISATSTTSSTTTTTLACTGNIALAFSQNPVPALTSVTPSSSGLSNCNDKTITYKSGSCTSGSFLSSCNSGSTGCTGSPFVSPATGGNYNYCAVIDKNGDGSTTGAGEQGSNTLTVSSTATTTSTTLCADNPSLCDGSCSLNKGTGTTCDCSGECLSNNCDAGRCCQPGQCWLGASCGTCPGSTTTTQCPDTAGCDTCLDQSGGTACECADECASGVCSSGFCTSATTTTLAGCVRAVPTVTIVPPIQTGSLNTPRTYTVTVTNNDNANCGSSPFDLTVNCPSGWACTLASTVMNLASGGAASTTLDVKPPLLNTVPPGTYTITVIATNRND